MGEAFVDPFLNARDFLLPCLDWLRGLDKSDYSIITDGVLEDLTPSLFINRHLHISFENRITIVRSLCNASYIQVTLEYRSRPLTVEEYQNIRTTLLFQEVSHTSLHLYPQLSILLPDHGYTFCRPSPSSQNSKCIGPFASIRTKVSIHPKMCRIVLTASRHAAKTGTP
jgi:hypothetical protein